MMFSPSRPFHRHSPSFEHDAGRKVSVSNLFRGTFPKWNLVRGGDSRERTAGLLLL
jgi:hypothetical protein